MREQSALPLAAYSVSGEYAMIKAASSAGLIDEYKVMCESAVSVYRAGADILITYFANERAAVRAATTSNKGTDMMTKQSAEWFARAQRVLPGGVNSPVRAFRAVGGAALYCVGKGRVFDRRRRQHLP